MTKLSAFVHARRSRPRLVVTGAGILMQVRRRSASPLPFVVTTTADSKRHALPDDDFLPLEKTVKHSVGKRPSVEGTVAIWAGAGKERLAKFSCEADKDVVRPKASDKERKVSRKEQIARLLQAGEDKCACSLYVPILALHRYSACVHLRSVFWARLPYSLFCLHHPCDGWTWPGDGGQVVVAQHLLVQLPVSVQPNIEAWQCVTLSPTACRAAAEAKEARRRRDCCM